jgi:hypothetical protein
VSGFGFHCFGWFPRLGGCDADGSFEQLPFAEHGAGADEPDQVLSIECAPAWVCGVDQLGWRRDDPRIDNHVHATT